MRGGVHRQAMGRSGVVLVAALLLVFPPVVRGGGPVLVGSPTLGIAGEPMIWDPGAMPVKYRVDGGPLAAKPDGTVVIDNTAGIARVKTMFDVWQNVPTAAISFDNEGVIKATGSFAGGDVKTLEQFIDVLISCEDGQQSPIIFDADGALFDELIGEPNVIGFASVCAVTVSGGRIASAAAALNGRFQDTIDSGNNFELTPAEFNEAFTHEFGHFSGLDHSQINLNVFSQTPGQCNLDTLAGLPLMFPVLFCQARVDAGLSTLAPDDLAWVSRLYPVGASPPTGKESFNAKYGTISGSIFFSDGITPAQGVNVIARAVDDPATTPNESRRVAVSVVSGYLFTGNFGQSVTCSDPADPTTCTNAGGSVFGSRDPRKIGSFDISVPPGTYTVEVESIALFFTGGSSVGPLDPPIQAPGTAPVSSQITVTAGATTLLDITLQGTPARFDSFESAQLWRHAPLFAWLRKENLAVERRAG